jgi:predicted RecB family nuclease
VIPARRNCPQGHEYWKSSDCPTCPVCEATRKPAGAFMEGLAAPARRALEGAGLTTLAKLAKTTEREILGLHGMGPASIPKLRAALRKDGKKFAED